MTARLETYVPDYEETDSAQEIATERGKLAERLEAVLAKAGELYEELARTGRRLTRATAVAGGPNVSCNRSLADVTMAQAHRAGLPVQGQRLEHRGSGLVEYIAQTNEHAVGSIAGDWGTPTEPAVPPVRQRAGKRGRR